MASQIISPVNPVLHHHPRLSSSEFQSYGAKFQCLKLGYYSQKETRQFPRLQVFVTDDSPPPPLPSPEFKELISSLKLKLLSAVSGLNRGIAATEEDLKRAEDVARELEAAGGPVDLSTDLSKLQGRWKLIYSSVFSSRLLGRNRPGPPTAGRLLPITVGQVYQRIDVANKDFANIVEIQLGAPWPLPPLEATSTYAYKFELVGSAKVKINFEKTTVKTGGNLSQLPPLQVPQIPDALRPQTNPGNVEFDVTYVDADTRVSRGDKGELRVFVIS